MNSTRKRLFQPLEDRHQLPDISNRDRLAKSLRRAVPEAVLFTALEKQAHKENVESGQPLSPQHLFMDAMAKPYTQDSTTEFISSLVISKDDVAVLEKATRGQSSSPIWTMARRGRLTASNFYSIYTKVQSIKKRPGTSADALLGKLMGYSRTSETLTAIKYGREMEADAKQALFEVFDKEHQEACCEPVGLVLSEQRAFLGASPDAVLSCKCHGQRVAELKCPMSCKDTAPSPTILPYLYESGDGLKLKTNHGYYAQCQGQMALTGYKLCSFYVYSPHGSIHIPVKFNKTYWEEIRDALDYFFKEYVAPELLTGRLKRELDASASGEVATSSTNHNTPSTSSAVPGTADTSHGLIPTFDGINLCQTVSPLANSSTATVSVLSPVICPICAHPCLEQCSRFTEGSVGCDTCNMWFHFTCVGIQNDQQVDNLPTLWQCSACAHGLNKINPSVQK
ncbi:uncharacterized protein LOC144905933 [Branchiostoma floridae x Branchiostoma belcheri]